MQSARRGIVLHGIALLVASATAQAAQDSPVLIKSILVDAQRETLTINGENLAGRHGTHLYLHGHAAELPVMTVSSSQIRARMPSGIVPGSYVLTVSGDTTQQAKLLVRSRSAVQLSRSTK